MGSRFVATQEAQVHSNVKQALIDRSERDTRLIIRMLRNTERVMSNTAVEKVLEIEHRAGETMIEDLVPYVAGRIGKRC